MALIILHGVQKKTTYGVIMRLTGSGNMSVPNVLQARKILTFMYFKKNQSSMTNACLIHVSNIGLKSCGIH